MRADKERAGRLGLSQWLGVLLLSLSACADQVVAPAALDPAVSALRDRAYRDNQAYAHVESLVTEVGPRFAGSANDRRAVAWALQKMQALGLQNVRAEKVTVPHWVRGPLSLRIVAPQPIPLQAVALGGSVATPATGIEAPVLAVQSLEELEWLPDSRVKGHIVFFNGRMERKVDGSGYGKAVIARTKGPARAARKGAAAVVIRSVGTDNKRIAHTGATQYEDGIRKIPAAALTQPDADLLERQLASGPVRLHLKLHSETLEAAESANVIGEVPGESDEIVLLGAHLDSWDTTPGANDDGVGVAIVLEAARQILRMGRKPRRTIRVVLYANEEFGQSGAKAYAADHAAELAKHVVAMEADSGSGPAIKLDARVPAESWAAVQEFARQLGLAPGDNSENGGADVGVLRSKGVPVFDPGQDASRYFDVHHTVDDTLAAIDREGLSQNVATYTALAWLASEQPAGFGRLDESQRGPKTLAWNELAQRPLPPKAQRIAYGDNPLQFGEFRLPEGKGAPDAKRPVQEKFPVAVVIHGGCWLNAFDYEHITRLSQALTASGIATWTVEYRRVGDTGGGWPGTFLDVAAGADQLHDLAKIYPLDLKRVIAIGHSAGGQLALWLASRGAVTPDSDLYVKNPLTLSGVLPLAPITDMASYASVPNCGEAVKPLMGGGPQDQAARYAQVSPMELPPLKIPVRLVHGGLDRIVPIEHSRRYAERAGSSARLIVVDDAGHFEPVSPASSTWPKVVTAAQELLKLGP